MCCHQKQATLSLFLRENMQQSCGLHWADAQKEMFWCFTIYALNKKDKCNLFISLNSASLVLGLFSAVSCSIVCYMHKQKSFSNSLQYFLPSSFLFRGLMAVFTWILTAFYMTHTSNWSILYLFYLTTNARVPLPSLKGQCLAALSVTVQLPIFKFLPCSRISCD